MEYVHGEDLRELRKRRRAQRASRCRRRWCAASSPTACAGLHYAHTAPTPTASRSASCTATSRRRTCSSPSTARVKLVDFGIAKASDQRHRQTQAGVLKGKFAYMSPEQARGEPVDARTDVFALGIVLWEMLTGGGCSSARATWRSARGRPRTTSPPARSNVRTCPPELERIVMRALKRPLSERYASALEMRADLEALIRTQRWEADAMALAHYLHELFAEKLEAQESDMRAAGVGSLDDFLLSVDGNTQISWMEPASAHKSSSLELPATTDTPLPPETRSGRSEPERPAPPPPPASPASPASPTSMDRSSPMVKLPASSLPTTPLAVPIAPADELPSQATVIVSQPAVSAPSPTNPAFNDTVRHVAFDNDTAPRPIDLPARFSQRLRRILVIGSAATVVAAIGLTVAFWPTSASSTVPSVPLAATPLPAAAPKPATLVITTDAPAVISVDGNPAPLGRSSTVQVKPGVEHVVTVRRPGHSLHTVHVPILAPGEQLPLQVQVR